jgi:pyruvate/2-oxoglutarate/acetoin dehydrogenase E1 component
MSKSEFTPYVDALTEAMKLVMDDPSTIFIGQQIVYYGNPMSKTIEGLPKERMIETPVMEETQMGMTLGLAMTGHRVVSFYPRWDFLICASNQLINHLDKLEAMSDGDWKPNVIIRVGKGSDKPLDPGHQHKADYTEEFSSMLKNSTVTKLDSYNKILPAYQNAIDKGGVHILVEYPEMYYEN